MRHLTYKRDTVMSARSVRAPREAGDRRVLTTPGERDWTIAATVQHAGAALQAMITGAP
jgi:hypothetical protein